MSIWTEIKYALNSTLGTPNFISLDKLLSGGQQVYDTAGSYTFNVPAGISTIQVIAAGAGGGGSKAGGGGGGGACSINGYSVTPLSKINITIGKGGLGGGQGTNNTDNGLDGGATIVGNLVTAPGGHGSTGFEGGEPGGAGGGKGGTTSNRIGSNGANGLYGAGGKVYSSNSNGSGGGGSYGKGGNGADQTTSSGEDRVDAENGVNGGGGGGGRALMTSSALGFAANGGDGIVIIRWGGAMQ